MPNNKAQPKPPKDGDKTGKAEGKIDPSTFCND